MKRSMAALLLAIVTVGALANAQAPVSSAGTPVSETPASVSSAPVSSAPVPSAPAPVSSAPVAPASSAPLAPLVSELPDAGLEADALGTTDAMADVREEDAEDGSAKGVETDATAAPDVVEAAPAASSAVVAAPVCPPSASPPAAPSQPKESPLWTLFPAMPEQPDGDALLHQILPSLGLTERGSLGGYFLLLVVTAGASVLVGVGRKRLPVRGVVPRLLSGLQMALRALVAVLGLMFVARWIPTSYAPVLLWVALAAAAAAGWSARDFLPDLLAGVVLLVERRIRPGVWVSGAGYAGDVQSLGPRAAKVRDQEGRIVSVPNRALLSGPVSVETSAHPQVEVLVRVPEGTSATRARRVIQDVALLSPWRVLREPPEVRRDGEDPRVWHVRVRLIEPQFLKAFESALADQVEECLGESGEGSRGPSTGTDKTGSGQLVSREPGAGNRD